MTTFTVSPSSNVCNERVIGDNPLSLDGRESLWREPLLNPRDLLDIFFKPSSNFFLKVVPDLTFPGCDALWHQISCIVFVGVCFV